MVNKKLTYNLRLETNHEGSTSRLKYPGSNIITAGDGLLFKYDVSTHKARNMPRPGLRVRSLRKVKVRLPGGASITHYFRRRPSQAVCAECKKPLHGVPRERPHGLKSIPLSGKRPTRPFGGNLCALCSREKMKARLR